MLFNIGGLVLRQISVIATVAIVAAALTVSGGAADKPADPKSPPPTTRPVGGNIVEGFRLSARAERDEFTVGQLVMLELTLTNTTDRVLELFETSIHRDVYLTVDQDRKRVPLTRLGLLYENRERWQKTRNQRIEVHPGEARKYRIAANLFYDMTLHGQYQIVAQFPVPVQGSRILTPGVCSDLPNSLART